MSKLAKIQQQFQNCLLLPEQGINNIQPDQPSWISASGRASPEKQLSIYSTGYRLRLKEVLENDFSSVVMAIGEQAFDKLADDYITAHPSHYFSLREFGKHLANYIASSNNISIAPG